MSEKKHIKLLLVDDDNTLRQLLSEYLNRQGYDTLIAVDANGLEAKIEKYSPDVLILDRMLPSGDGLDACIKLREAGINIPVIMLTAKDTINDRIHGLEMGADDYLGKPFDPRELVARIESLLRRHIVTHKTLKSLDTLDFGPFTYSYSTRTLKRDDKIIRLTSGELSILEALINHSGRALSREELLDYCHDDGEERNNRAIDITVLRLRRVIEDDPKKPRWIRTVWGEGYCFTPDPEEFE
ncbi:response regulator [Basilea psittacipulmonis]|uniref:Osmolarity response regulator n=1 Tax=Basilea psittacipulmonis DSM 24701 TaxID=1072685 RepID=A0A077DIL1_9BURK|nr:response regulator [Basilea psittacipulmonis]AIL33013.1 osmolarity response regulator [Basilea psittacipulmonis DSM 24701]